MTDELLHQILNCVEGQDLDDVCIDGQMAHELVEDLVHTYKEELRELLNA